MLYHARQHDLCVWCGCAPPHTKQPSPDSCQVSAEPHYRDQRYAERAVCPTELDEIQNNYLCPIRLGVHFDLSN